MSNVTTAERLKFMQRASAAMNELSTTYGTVQTSLYDVAKRIGVSSIFKIVNMVGKANQVNNAKFSKIGNGMLEILAVFEKDAYNTGDYKSLVRTTKNAIEENLPSAAQVEFTPVSINAEGNENVSPANVAELDDVLKKLSNVNRTTLLDISAAAGKMKSDTNRAVSNIGASCETITNDCIDLANKLRKELAQFTKMYKIQLSAIEDLAGSLRSSVTAENENVDITVEI